MGEISVPPCPATRLLHQGEQPVVLINREDFMATANPSLMPLHLTRIYNDTSLQLLLDGINKRHFAGRIQASIRWEIPAGRVSVFTGIAHTPLLPDSPYHQAFAHATDLLDGANPEQALPLLIDCTEAGHEDAHLLLNHLLKRLGDARWEKYSRQYNQRQQFHKVVPAACYYPESKAIAIHPHISERKAPQFVLKYLIFHECCHQLFESDASNPHPPEFMQWEARAPGRERALEWLEKEGFPTLPLNRN